MKIDIKPLSVNKVWQGRRFKTSIYKVYEEELYYLLPGMEFGDEIKLRIEFGFSNMRMDIDNPVKPLLDVMQKKYGFNDNQITQLHLFKKKVKKGKEYIKIEVL